MLDDFLEKVALPRRGGIAAALARASHETVIDMRPRAKFREGALFEAGSLTKTMTATLLAKMVMSGDLKLETTVGELLGAEAGAARDIELRELATHTSGMPRLAPNAITLPFWPRDPYRFYGRRRLVKGLGAVELKERGTFSYSNIGFDLLGFCLSAAAGEEFNALLRREIFEPARMKTARCQPCERRGLVRGHGSLLLGGRRWHQPIAGAGGVDCSIDDLARWLEVNLHPESSPLEPAIRLCHEPHARSAGDAMVGLAWQISDGLIWHNGATGAFQGFVGFTTAFGGLATMSNVGPSKDAQYDRVAATWIRERARETS